MILSFVVYVHVRALSGDKMETAINISEIRCL